MFQVKSGLRSYQSSMPMNGLDAYAQIGRAVAELHRISFSDFGGFSEDGTVQAEPSFLDALTQRIQRHITSPRLVEMALSVLETHANLLHPTQATLCHEDLHRHNMLFHQIDGRWQLATILDFDKAWAGHHEIDLARMELWHGQTGDGFWPAYAALIPLDSDYSQRRPDLSVHLVPGICGEYPCPLARHPTFM